MTAPHPLSAVETEALRQMRTRLNKPAVSDAAAATLGRAALQVLARSDVVAAPATAPLPMRELRAAAEGAQDLPALSRVAGAVAAALGQGAKAVLVGGAVQALIGRRLQLAGREGVEARG